MYTVEEELIDESIEKASHSWDTFPQKRILMRVILFLAGD